MPRAAASSGPRLIKRAQTRGARSRPVSAHHAAWLFPSRPSAPLATLRENNPTGMVLGIRCIPIYTCPSVLLNIPEGQIMRLFCFFEICLTPRPNIQPKIKHDRHPRLRYFLRFERHLLCHRPSNYQRFCQFTTSRNASCPSCGSSMAFCGPWAAPMKSSPSTMAPPIRPLPSSPN